jgi:hypothetical protein
LAFIIKFFKMNKNDEIIMNTIIAFNKAKQCTS